MNDILKTYMERFRENRHTLRRYTAFVLALAMITTLFVNWQLHGVGISMTAQYQCGEEEHTHTADCYTKVLICGYEEGELENADEVPAVAAQQNVDEEGYADFTKLPQGLYLVMQTEASHGYEAIKPFLVSIPLPDGDSWIYDVDATPKVGATIPDTPETPPDTPETPPDTPDTPPDTPDTPPDTPDLPEQPDTPDTPVSPDSPDNPVSPSNPDNPVSPGNPDNPVSPSNPDKPVLPQTGQLNWPVPVLACSGVLLFAVGWVLNRQGKKEH